MTERELLSKLRKEAAETFNRNVEKGLEYARDSIGEIMVKINACKAKLENSEKNQ